MADRAAAQAAQILRHGKAAGFLQRVHLFKLIPRGIDADRGADRGRELVGRGGGENDGGPEITGLGRLAGGYYFVSLSMSRVEPITAALLSNLEPILNPVWVFLFLGEQPGALTLIGAMIVLVTATVYALLPVGE